MEFEHLSPVIAMVALGVLAAAPVSLSKTRRTIVGRLAWIFRAMPPCQGVDARKCLSCKA